MCCFSDNLGGSESPIDLENQLNDVDVQSKPLPDENSSTDDSKWNFVDMVKDFGVFSTLFVSGLIVYFLYNVSYYWPASKTFSMVLFGIYALIIPLVILMLYGLRTDDAWYCNILCVIVLSIWLFAMKPELAKMWLGTNAIDELQLDTNYNLHNPPVVVTIYAGAWIEIGGFTPVGRVPTYLKVVSGLLRTKYSNRVGQDGVVQLKESSADMFKWETSARRTLHFDNTYVMVDTRLGPEPVNSITLTSANVKPTIILHGNRGLSVHGLPRRFHKGAYLIIATPPAYADLLVGGYTRQHVSDDTLNHGQVPNPIIKKYIYASVGGPQGLANGDNLLLWTPPVDISEGGRNQFGAFVLTGANHASLFEDVEEARLKGWPIFVSSDRFNAKNAVQIELTVQCSELKKCGI
eukprot:93625_1